MLFTEEKLIKRQAEVDKYRYLRVLELTEFAFAEDEEGANGVYPEAVSFDGIIRLQEHWRGRDRYVWYAYSDRNAPESGRLQNRRQI